MELSEEVVQRLHRARGTVYEMLKDRGYTLKTQPCSLIEFQRRLALQPKDQLLKSLMIRGYGGRRPVLAFFCPLAKIGIGIVRDLVAVCEELKVAHAIVIYEGSITPFAMQNLQEISKQPDSGLSRVETFTFNDLQINPTHHVLVPKHRLLSSKATTAKLAERNLTLTDLPRMLPTDAIARYYGAHRGSLFCIDRKSPEGMMVEALRVVSG